MRQLQPGGKAALGVIGVIGLVTMGLAMAQAPGGKPDPDVKDARYGPHERNVLDLWKAKSDTPTPLVVFIHGGGFRAGDKANLDPDLLRKCLEAGISVASINYRLSQQAPFPAPMLDGARAIQYLRSRAGEWNLDPDRLAASGGSAGAGISLWVGFHDDLADPHSDDPVARQSTRLACMGVVGAQSTYDPRVIKKEIGGRAHEHPALQPFYGLSADELDSSRAHAMYEAASAINYASADDPPVFLYYNEPKGPLPADAGPGQGIHHPRFGTLLREKLDPLGVACVIRHRDDYRADAPQTMHREMVEFFREQFDRAKRAKGAGPTGSARGVDGVQAVIDEVDRACRERTVYMIGPQKARRLAALVRGKRPRRVVECGTAIGYSGLWIGRELKALGSGRLISIEIDPERAREAEANFRKAGLSDVVEVRVGDARRLVKEVEGPVDCLFIDCNFENYEACFAAIEDKLQDGALVIADNVGIGARAMVGYLERVRSGHNSRTEWFDLDLPWEKRDAMEITVYRNHRTVD